MARQDDRGSVTLDLGGLKAGNTEAVQSLWDRYFDRLIRLARARLRATRKPRAVDDEEDAALSAFDSFCARAARGEFPQLADRDDLWRILVAITRRKALDQVEREGRQKRGSSRIAPCDDFDRIVGTEPSPEFAAMITEEFRRLLEALGDATLRKIAVWKMEGYTNEQIRSRLGCALQTVNNKLELIRRKWLEEQPA